MNCLIKILGLVIIFVFCSCTMNNENKVHDVDVDTLNFRICIYADSEGVQHYGGRDSFKVKLNSLFDKVNENWNGKDSMNFNHYYNYIPVLKEVYDKSSTLVEKESQEIFDSINYDLLMIIDCCCNHDDENGGWYCGAGKNGLPVVAIKNGSKGDEYQSLLFSTGWEGITHELGHYRGVTDLYADNVREDRNHLNGKSYTADKCIMNYCYGVKEWSSYAKNIINLTALSKRPSIDFPNLFFELFPKKLLVKIDAKNLSKGNIPVRLYGTRALYNDVILPAYRTFYTNDSGECLIDSIPIYYTNPPLPGRPEDLPWGRWFGFIVEVEINGIKYHEWLPEYKIQNITFSGDSIYNLPFKFEK